MFVRVLPSQRPPNVTTSPGITNSAQPPHTCPSSRPRAQPIPEQITPQTHQPTPEHERCPPHMLTSAHFHQRISRAIYSRSFFVHATHAQIRTTPPLQQIIVRFSCNKNSHGQHQNPNDETQSSVSVRVLPSCTSSRQARHLIDWILPRNSREANTRPLAFPLKFEENSSLRRPLHYG